MRVLTANRPPSLTHLLSSDSPEPKRQGRTESVLIVEPSSPHYVPRGFSNEPDTAGGSPLIPHGDRFGGLDAAELSCSGMDAKAAAAVAPTVQSTFRLPPLLVVCLVRHVGKDGEVLSTPSSVEQVVRDLQLAFSTPVAAERIHERRNARTGPIRSATTASSPVPPRLHPTSTSTAAGAATATVTDTALPAAGASLASGSGGRGRGHVNQSKEAAPGAGSSDQQQQHVAHKGSCVSLQFGKAVDLYSTGGSAILNLFIYAVDEPHSRPRRMAEVAREWREHLGSAVGGGGGASCMVLLYHHDLVTAARVRGEAVDTAKVEAAAAVLETYYTELRTLGFRPQQMAAYHPQETPVRLLERLRTACAERGDRLGAIYESYHKAKRGTAAGGASPRPAPPPPSITTAASAPGTQGGPAPPAPPPPPWSVQQLWRLGYDAVLHNLQFGLVADAQRVLQRLYLEYYNNSDDYPLVTQRATLERLGRVPNLFDARRAGTEPGRTGYPKALEAAAEPIDGLLLLAAADMACWALMGNVSRCRARYETFIQVVREKFAEEPDVEEDVGGDEEGIPKSEGSPVPPPRGLPRILQQFFLLQCHLSGLRTFWPLCELATHAPAPSAAAAAAAAVPVTALVDPQRGRATEADDVPHTSPASSHTGPAHPPTSEPILVPLELDKAKETMARAVAAAQETASPIAPSPPSALSFSIMGAPEGFVVLSTPLPTEAGRVRALGAERGGPARGRSPHTGGRVESVALPRALSQMLHLDVDLDSAGEAGVEVTAGGRGHELLRLAFESGSDAVGDSVAYLVRLAQGVGFLPPGDVPVELGDRVPPRLMRQVQGHCLHIADLAVGARDCLSFMGDAMGFGAGPSAPQEGHRAASAFHTDAAAAALSPTTQRASWCADGGQPASHAVDDPTARLRECRRAAALRACFANVEELQSAENALRLWRLLTVMAGVAVRIAGQRRREFNHFTRLALTYLTDDPASTMRIVARRLVPYIREKGWWHLELFVRRLYVEGADHLMELVDAHTHGLSREQRGRIWRLVFADESAYAMYKECLLRLLHTDAAGGEDGPHSSGEYAGLEAGSLDGRVFRPRPREELWRRMLTVDALVEEALFGEHAPEYPLESLADHLRIDVRRAPAAEEGAEATEQMKSEDERMDSDGSPTPSPPPADMLCLGLEETVTLTFTCHCPVDVMPSLPDHCTTIRAVLESRRDWDDPAEATHVVALADGDVHYNAAARTLTARFTFVPCHAGLYRLRSVGLRNAVTRLSYYPHRTEANAAVVVTTEAAGSCELTYGEAVRTGGRADGCARVLFAVREPVSGVRLRVSPPPEEHCFADALTHFTLHVAMEQPLTVPERGRAAVGPVLSGTVSEAKRLAAASTFSDAASSGGDEETAEAGADSGSGVPTTTTTTTREQRGSPSASVPSARGVVQERMRRSVRAVPGSGALSTSAAAAAGSAGARRECVFETSPASLPAALPLANAGSLGASLGGSHRGLGSAPSARHPSLSAAVSASAGGASPPTPSLLAGGHQRLDGSLSFPGGGHGGLVAVVQVTPAKVRARAGAAMASTPPSASRAAQSLARRPAHGRASIARSMDGVDALTLAATPTMPAGEGGSYPFPYHGGGVTVEREPRAAPPTPGTSVSFGGAAPVGGAPGSRTWGCTHAYVAPAHRSPVAATAGVAAGAEAGGGGGGEEGDALSATRRSSGGEEYRPLGFGGDATPDGVTALAPPLAVDGVRLALHHQGPRLRCAGDRLSPVGVADTGPSTQVRVIVNGPAPQDGSRRAGGPGQGPTRIPGPTQGRGDAMGVEEEEEEEEDAAAGSGGWRNGGGGGLSTAVTPDQLPRTVIPFDEAVVMRGLAPPTSEGRVEWGGDVDSDRDKRLPLTVSGAVSLFPRRECTYWVSVEDAADPAAMVRTTHMRMQLPLLPLFVAPQERGGHGAAAAPVAAVSPAEGEDETPTSTVSFSCLRGRESCTSSVAVSFPFHQAISARFAFRHFQARVYCHVTLTNELTRTSLWLRGVLLHMLDRMPTYEVARVSDSYTSLLHREWRPGESLSIVFELALCRSFQPTEAVLRHRVHVQVLYSDWTRTYLRTLPAHRVVLEPMRLPETEAGAESVRIEDVSETGTTPVVDMTLATATEEGLPVSVRGSSPEVMTRRASSASRPDSEDAHHQHQLAAHRAAGATSDGPLSSPVMVGANGGAPTGLHSPASASTASRLRLLRSPTGPESSEEGSDHRLGDHSRTVRYNPVLLSLLSATCNTFVSQTASFRSKHLCLFSAVMWAESPWKTRFGAATNYASSTARSRGNGSGQPGSTLTSAASSLGGGGGGGGGMEGTGLMADAMVDQPADFRFVAGEPVRFCVRLEPSAHNWPEEAGVEEDFFVQLQYDPTQWMVIGKQRERRTLSLMEDVSVTFTAVPLLPPTAVEEGVTGGGQDGAERRVRLAGNSVQDEGILRTPTIKVFWANPPPPLPGAPATTRERGQVLVDVVRFRTFVRVYKKIR